MKAGLGLDLTSVGLELIGLFLPHGPSAEEVILQQIAELKNKINDIFTNMNYRFDRVGDLAASGQPELPRLVGQVLRLLNLLRDAWATVPPAALEIGSVNQSPRPLLYGEPYAHYTLQYSDDLGLPGWTTTTITNLHNEQLVAPPIAGSP